MQRVFRFHLIHLVSVQFSRSVMPNSATPWTAALQASLSITNSQHLRKFMFIQSVMLSNHIILCHSLLLRLQSFPASGSFLVSQFFTSGGQNIVVSASASVLPKKIQNWFPLGWIGWISLPRRSPVQGTLKSLLQNHSSKGSILRHSAFFIVQLSHPYMTTGKTIALSRWTFVDQVMSLLLICCLGCHLVCIYSLIHSIIHSNKCL